MSRLIRNGVVNLMADSPCCAASLRTESSLERQVVLCVRCGDVLAPYILFPNQEGLNLETGIVERVAVPTQLALFEAAS